MSELYNMGVNRYSLKNYFLNIKNHKKNHQTILQCIGINKNNLVKFKQYIKKDINEFVGMIICALMFLITFRVARGATENAVAAIFLFIYCGRKIRFEKIAKVTMTVSSFVFLFVILSGYIGWIDNYLYVKSGRARWCLGFRYALFAPTYYFNIVSLWTYLRMKTAKIWEIIDLLIIDYWLYVKTDSRITACFTACLIVVPLVYSLYLKFARDRLVAFKKIFCVTIPSFVLFGLLAILLTIMYDPQIYWMKRVNQALKGRLSLGQNAINNYGIHLFGKHIEMTGNGMDAYGQISTETYSYVDSFYVQILLRYGIVFVLVLAFMLTVVMYRSYKNNYFYLLFVLTLIGIHYIIDDLQLYLYYNTFWFAIGNVFINRNSKKYLLPEDKIVA
jgi:hypothetical protein